MKKKEYKLQTTTDIKIFLLYLLANIGYPIDHSTLIGMVADNTNEITIDYDTCLRELADSEHICYDEVDGVKYYMIADKGDMVAAELYDTLDEGFRERSMRSVVKYLSLTKRNARTDARISVTEDNRYAVRLTASDLRGELLDVTLTVSAEAEANLIKENFERRPDSVYRGFLFAATGRIEFIT